MLTRSIIAQHVAWAGVDYMWNGGPRPGHRLSAAPRRGLRQWLWEFSGGLCVFCDDEVPFEEFEMCHIVSRGPEKRGWLPGNIATGCAHCNITQAFLGPIVEFDSIKRPDLIPTEWPSTPFLRDKGNMAKVGM